MNEISAPASPEWSLRTKIVVSALVALHLFAVFAAPCASPPPASDTFQRISGRMDGQDGLLTPYLRAAFLKHGYRFFAPNPGPSHLVRYEIDLATGGSLEGSFPDPEEYFPRLLNHRMFMLSETAFNLVDPVLAIPEAGSLTPAEKQAFDTQLAAAESLANAISRHFLQMHDGKRIRLYLQTHELPFPEEVAAGKKLDDPNLYVERFWCEVSRDQIELETDDNNQFARATHAEARGGAVR